jgi:hypothetical protein
MKSGFLHAKPYSRARFRVLIILALILIVNKLRLYDQGSKPAKVCQSCKVKPIVHNFSESLQGNLYLNWLRLFMRLIDQTPATRRLYSSNAASNLCLDVVSPGTLWDG